MSREKQIEEMARIICRDYNGGICATDGFVCNYNCEWTQIAKHLYNAGYRKQSEWISVEERLPECERGAESKAVLFITKQGFMYTGYYGCGGIFRDRYFREFKNATEGCDISNVTHWMPLPPPPKENKND